MVPKRIEARCLAPERPLELYSSVEEDEDEEEEDTTDQSSSSGRWRERGVVDTLVGTLDMADGGGRVVDGPLEGLEGRGEMEAGGLVKRWKGLVETSVVGGRVEYTSSGAG